MRGDPPGQIPTVLSQVSREGAVEVTSHEKTDQLRLPVRPQRHGFVRSEELPFIVSPNRFDSHFADGTIAGRGHRLGSAVYETRG